MKQYRIAIKHTTNTASGVDINVDIMLTLSLDVVASDERGELVLPGTSAGTSIVTLSWSLCVVLMSIEADTITCERVTNKMYIRSILWNFMLAIVSVLAV